MPVSITCPLCKKAFPVPTEVVGVDEARNLAYVRMDRSGLYGHMQTCAAEQGDKAGAALVNGEQTKAVERPPIAQPHDVPPFVAKGKRPCVGCGIEAPECLERLHRSRTGCCRWCEGGNTHPAPKDTIPCAEWAADRTASAQD